ncbi:MAG TPA: hypothetical protein VK054_05470, partial [Beutenbergiaceae bacterium]|nr:hypothetical protein [Beutenbergiaceae bacterium]
MGTVHQRKRDGKWVATVEAGWTARGTRRRITRTANSKREAMVHLRDLERELLLEGAPEEGQNPRETVKNWFETWLEHTRATLTPSSWATNRSAVNQWITPEIGHIRLTALGAQHARKVNKAVLDAGRAPSTAIRTHSVLIQGLQAALLEGHRIPQPIFLVPAPTAGDQGKREAIPLGDSLKILQAALETTYATRWVAALLQALRPAEARGLTWSAINFNKGEIDISWQLKPLPYNTPRDRTSGFRVPTGYDTLHLVDAYHLVRPKTRAGRRIIPMVPWMRDALLKWRERAEANDYDLVWPNGDGRPMTDKQDRAL